jgi:uncharacterized protein (TIGR00299 family) protein
MMLGALVDAGARLDGAVDAVEAVIPGSVVISARQVMRGEMRATKVDVVPCAPAEHHRSWSEIRRLIEAAVLDDAVRARALAVFEALARAEGRVHGVPADDVRFHEVGAWDSIADIVGVSAALEDLHVVGLTCSAIAVGSGVVRGAHGPMPVPVPAVVELTAGLRIFAGGEGELATPTGAAILAALGEGSEDCPELRLVASGVGAGTRDRPERANVVRVLLGVP